MIDFDVLAHLRRQAHSASDLAGVLPANEPEIQAVLERLRADELVSGLPSGYSDPSTHVVYWTVQPAAEDLYGRLLDRFEVPLVGVARMTVLARFVVALADGAPGPLQRQLVTEAENLPLEDLDSRRRHDALTLARYAVGLAQRALDADPQARTGAAAALRSLRLLEAEDLGYVARRLCEYVGQLADASFVGVIEHAAAACEGAWELRLLGPRDPKTHVSHERHIDPDAYVAVAEHTAAALKALASATSVDVLSEARAVIVRLRPPALQTPPS